MLSPLSCETFLLIVQLFSTCIAAWTTPSHWFVRRGGSFINESEILPDEKYSLTFYLGPPEEDFFTLHLKAAHVYLTESYHKSEVTGCHFTGPCLILSTTEEENAGNSVCPKLGAWFKFCYGYIASGEITVIKGDKSWKVQLKRNGKEGKVELKFDQGARKELLKCTPDVPKKIKIKNQDIVGAFPQPSDEFYNKYELKKSHLIVHVLLSTIVWDKYKNETKIHDWVKQTFNHVNWMFEPLKMKVHITGVEIFKTENKIKTNFDAMGVYYHKAKKGTAGSVISKETQVVVYVTTDFNHIGLGGGLPCTGGLILIRPQHALHMAEVMAHEIGHILGFPHDFLARDKDTLGKDGNCCKHKLCVMNDAGRSVDFPTPFWSECNFKDMQRRQQSGKHDCMLKPPNKTFYGSICGNGILEQGEECDCGTPAACIDLCCDPLKCSFLPAGKICRAAKDSCDDDEMCSGTSKNCPDDSRRSSCSISESGGGVVC